jgi:lysophospholipid acyltransferase (LPLAT)-like uncharacterized protein
MNALKKIYRSKYVVRFLAFFFYLVCKYFVKLNKVEIELSEPVIYCFWHGRIFPMANFIIKKNDTHVVISLHGDGELISRTISHFGVKSIRGSSNRVKGSEKNPLAKDRGGSRVIRDSIDKIQSGADVVVTPDGPKGPKYVFKKNSLMIAKLTGAKIINLSFSASNKIVFNSWDNFILPLPFGKINLVYGKVFEIPKDATDDDIEKIRKEIEDDLNKVTKRADVKTNNSIQ